MRIARSHSNAAFHLYRERGVMGDAEPRKHVVPHGIGVVGKVTAPTHRSSTRVSMLRMTCPGQMVTASDCAIPLDPPEHSIGPVCKFSIHHQMEVTSPTEPFPIHHLEA